MDLSKKLCPLKFWIHYSMCMSLITLYQIIVSLHNLLVFHRKKVKEDTFALLITWMIMLKQNYPPQTQLVLLINSLSSSNSELFFFSRMVFSKAPWQSNHLLLVVPGVFLVLNSFMPLWLLYLWSLFQNLATRHFSLLPLCQWDIQGLLYSQELCLPLVWWQFSQRYWDMQQLSFQGNTHCTYQQHCLYFSVLKC